MLLTPRFALATAVLALTAIAPSQAATFVVDSTGDDGDAVPGDRTCATLAGECTLRAAIEEANRNVEADRIELPAGAFPGRHSIESRMHVVGQGPDETVIRGGIIGPVLSVGSWASLGLFDVTLTGGSAELGAGGLHAEGSLSLANVHVTACTGEFGGVRATGPLIMNGVVISGCTGTGRYREGGLSLTASAGVSILGCTFRDNTGSGLSARDAGAATPVLIRDCTFERNRTSAEGGAIRAFRSSLTIERSTMAANEAEFGGAIHVANWERGTVTLMNCTLSGNSAEEDGGGLHGASSIFALAARSTTIVHNSARRGGGLALSGTMQLDDVILFGNEADLGPDCSGALVGQGNLIGDTSGGTLGGGVVLTSESPLLGPLADNGGPTFTHALQPGSPAIDAGLSTVLAVDQRGVARPSGVAPDIGAYELDQTADADGDGTPDVLDNCIGVANESQLDADADGWGDECDCAPSDAGAFAVPEGVTLLVTRTGGVVLSWTDVADLVGPGVQHDIASDTLDSLSERGIADAPCLETGWTETSWLDTDAPAAGHVYYLVRPVNACGPAPGEGWGHDSLSRARGSCP